MVWSSAFRRLSPGRVNAELRTSRRSASVALILFNNPAADTLNLGMMR